MSLDAYLQVIIDGYNFLMTTGMMDTKVSDLELQKGRTRLLQFLARVFQEPINRQKITVVFDSRTSLSLPTTLKHQNIDVVFSKGYDTADELIIEMIQQNHVPKRLLIVSSDHEIQKSAKRRKAKFIDSDAWLDQLENQEKRSQSQESGPSKTTSGEDNQFWIDRFSSTVDSELDLDLLSGMDLPEKQLPENEYLETDSKLQDSPCAKPNSRARGNIGDKDRHAEKPGPDDGIKTTDLQSDNLNIFPPGYAEDLLEEHLQEQEKSAEELLDEVMRDDEFEDELGEN